MGGIWKITEILPFSTAHYEEGRSYWTYKLPDGSEEVCEVPEDVNPAWFAREAWHRNPQGMKVETMRCWFRPALNRVQDLAEQHGFRANPLLWFRRYLWGGLKLTDIERRDLDDLVDMISRKVFGPKAVAPQAHAADSEEVRLDNPTKPLTPKEACDLLGVDVARTPGKRPNYAQAVARCNFKRRKVGKKHQYERSLFARAVGDGLACQRVRKAGRLCRGPATAKVNLFEGVR